MQLPFGPLGAHTVKTLALIEGIDAQNPKAIANMLVDMCTLRIEQYQSILEAARKIERASKVSPAEKLETATEIKGA